MKLRYPVEYPSCLRGWRRLRPGQERRRQRPHPRPRPRPHREPDRPRLRVRPLLGVARRLLR